MTEKHVNRWRTASAKAAATAPLALLCVALTGSVVGLAVPLTSASQGPAEAPPTLPDGSAMPTETVEEPASLTAPTAPSRGVAPRAADAGSVMVPVSQDLALTTNPAGIPSPAMSAYQRAEAVMRTAAPDCALSWPLVAAIGRVESDHGSHGDSTLDDEGRAAPPIIGLPLDGTSDTARITDTDGGRLDSDTTYDRAVGPMQFIPSTWSVVGVDGDADGTRDPQDIDDAALASAVYLCSGGESLAEEAGRRDAVHRYNHSDEYVDLVLALADAYEAGGFDDPFAQAASQVWAGPSTAANALTTPVRATEPRKVRALGRTRERVPATRPRPPVPPVAPPVSPPPATPTPPGTPSPAPPEAPRKPKAPTPVIPASEPPLPVPPVPSTGVAPVDAALTEIEAQARCVAEGVSVLDAAALRECVARLLAP